MGPFKRSNWDAVLGFLGAGPVHHAAVSPNGDTIAIVMKSGETHLGNNYYSKYLHGGSHINWQHFSGRPRFIAFSPSGDLMMITTGDGVVWFCSMEMGAAPEMHGCHAAFLTTASCERVGTGAAASGNGGC